MEVLSILSDHAIVFSVLVGILIVNFIGIIYLMIKERNEDQNEINSLLNDRKLIEKNSITNEELVQDEKLEKNKKEVEDMLKAIQYDLENQDESAVETFENEQEENSIISYQELLESVKKQPKVNVAPIKIEEEPKINLAPIEIEEEPVKIVEDIIKKEPEINVIDKEEKFKNTDFISPIFGKQDNVFKYNTVPKKVTEPTLESHEKKDVIDTSKLEYEIRKNDDFLSALKEFRKNLD